VAGEVGRATKVNASIVRREFRLSIRDSGFDRNANLTTFIKGSSGTLRDSGQLMRSVAFRSISPFRAEVGVLKGDPSANIAIIVHEGATIPVTAKMRGMFAALADASSGQRTPGRLRGRARELFDRRSEGWKPLRPSTTAIRVPARPYMRRVVERPELHRALAKNWLAAAAAAIAGTRASLSTRV
jgi:hypothetical protein